MIDVSELQRSIRLQGSRPRPTPRQLQVARGMADGLSDREIASRLGISIGTARTHGQSLLHRTNTHTRSAAVAVCIRRGWI